MKIETKWLESTHSQVDKKLLKKKLLFQLAVKYDVIAIIYNGSVIQCDINTF